MHRYVLSYSICYHACNLEKSYISTKKKKNKIEYKIRDENITFLSKNI